MAPEINPITLAIVPENTSHRYLFPTPSVPALTSTALPDSKMRAFRSALYRKGLLTSGLSSLSIDPHATAYDPAPLRNVTIAQRKS